MKENEVIGRSVICVSISAENQEFLQEMCKKRGERSRIINEAIRQYRGDINNLINSDLIERVCIGYKLQIIPLLHNSDKDDVLFLMQKCKHHDIRCNQAYAEVAIQKVFENFKPANVEQQEPEFAESF